MSCLAGQKNLKHGLICFLLICCCSLTAVAKEAFFSWDFSDCEIKDILYAISLDSGISIYADDTVSGKGDLKFAGKDFEDAFDSFLVANRLFVQKNENLWVVSRFRMFCENGLFYVDAFDMTPSEILDKVCERLECVVTFDNLPGQRISVHFNGVEESAILESLAKRFGSYSVSKNNLGYHFEKKNSVQTMEISEGFVEVECEGEIFSVNVRDGKFADVVEKLFALDSALGNRRSFCFLSSGDVSIKRSCFLGYDFKDTLKKICAQNGYSFVCEDEVFYLFAENNSRNELIYGERRWEKFSLNFTKAQDFLPFLNKKNGSLETMVLPDGYSFLCCVSNKEKNVVQDLIDEVDIEIENFLISLKFLKPEEIMEYLPPETDKKAIYLADNNSKLYFRGTKSAFEKLQKQIEICDQPVKRLSYDLLILQYDDTEQNNWASSLEIGKMKYGDRNGFGVTLGSVVDFNLNVVTSFGLGFALDLQNSIEENRTKVFADTTLHGVSGKKISFQSTNTYRYRDNNVDPETGKPVYSGITKEISSGIKLEIQGWISGDGMITSSVVASVSRQGVDTSSTTGNPPPTSEKMVTTEVRSKSGEPIVLSGLVMEAESNQVKRVPFISKIPLIGNLFKSKEKNKEKSQMVIYLVPHYENEGNGADNQKKGAGIYDEKWVNARIESFYKKCGMTK